MLPLSFYASILPTIPTHPSSAISFRFTRDLYHLSCVLVFTFTFTFKTQFTFSRSMRFSLQISFLLLSVFQPLFSFSIFLNIIFHLSPFTLSNLSTCFHRSFVSVIITLIQILPSLYSTHLFKVYKFLGDIFSFRFPFVACFSFALHVNTFSFLLNRSAFH